jgi:hypothetical protein
MADTNNSDNGPALADPAAEMDQSAYSTGIVAEIFSTIQLIHQLLLLPKNAYC